MLTEEQFRDPSHFPELKTPFKAFGDWDAGERWIGKEYQVPLVDKKVLGNKTVKVPELEYQGVSEKGTLYWVKSQRLMVVAPRHSDKCYVPVSLADYNKAVSGC